jgi:mRNA interferase ChpB
VVSRIFERGDIVSVPLDPVSGREQMGKRPALVLTTKEFNKLGDVLVAPITQGGDFARYAGFAVNLMGTGTKTQGVALINKIRMLDLAARQARKIESAPPEVVAEAVDRLIALLDAD